MMEQREASRMTPVKHFERFGREEGRIWCPPPLPTAAGTLSLNEKPLSNAGDATRTCMCPMMNRGPPSNGSMSGGDSHPVCTNHDILLPRPPTDLDTP